MKYTIFLRFIRPTCDYGLETGQIYPCQIYMKNNFIWIRARSYDFKFPKKYVSIPYKSLYSISIDWEDA